MTTIAYRDDVMAADSRGYSGGVRPIGSKVKIERLADGSLLGVSSSIAGGAETVRQWIKDGRPADVKLPATFSMLHVLRNGEVYYASDTHHISGPLTAPFFAIGSGCEFAIGAMEHGATAVEAMRVACKHDVWSDFPIYAVRHDAAWRWKVER